MWLSNMWFVLGCRGSAQSWCTVFTGRGNPTSCWTRESYTTGFLLSPRAPCDTWAVVGDGEMTRHTQIGLPGQEEEKAVCSEMIGKHWRRTTEESKTLPYMDNEMLLWESSSTKILKHYSVGTRQCTSRKINLYTRQGTSSLECLLLPCSVGSKQKFRLI